MSGSRVLFVCMAVAGLGCAGLSASEPEAPEAAEVSAATVEPTFDEVAPPSSAEPAEPRSVARSAFTTAIADREPTDDASALTNDISRVLFFTELHGLQGQTVVHRWLYRGEVMAEVPFQVGGPRWRVHSSKGLDPSWLGEWTVSVLADGEVLASEGFTYTDTVDVETPAPSPAAATETPSQTSPAAATETPPQTSAATVE